MSDDLLSPEELAEARRLAAEIEAKPKPEYKYRTENKGGPKKGIDIDNEQLVEASVELTALRMVFDEFEDRAEVAKLMLWERMEEFRDAGMSIEFITVHSGHKHRTETYRVLDKYLPKLRAKIAAADELRKQLRKDDES